MDHPLCRRHVPTMQHPKNPPCSEAHINIFPASCNCHHCLPYSAIRTEAVGRDSLFCGYFGSVCKWVFKGSSTTYHYILSPMYCVTCFCLVILRFQVICLAHDKLIACRFLVCHLARHNAIFTYTYCKSEDGNNKKKDYVWWKFDFYWQNNWQNDPTTK